MHTQTTIEIYRPELEEAIEHAPRIIIEFAEEIKCKHKPIAQDIKEGMENLWSMMILVFAKKKGSVIGGMQSIMCPHIWNKGVMSSQEMFFWIQPDQRMGSAASRMLKFHEEQLDLLDVRLRAMSIMDSSQKGVSRAYNRMGYNQTEEVFTKWI